MKRIMIFLTTSLVILLISACSASNSPSDSIIRENTTVTQISSPENGKASVTGQLVREQTDEPLAETIIRLAEVFREEGTESEGAYVLDVAFSPGDISDSKGYFAIENITPGEYVIVVGDPYGDHDILEDNDGRAKVWEFLVDQVTNLGVIEANP